VQAISSDQALDYFSVRQRTARWRGAFLDAPEIILVQCAPLRQNPAIDGILALF
jgi:hypothetical protein